MAQEEFTRHVGSRLSGTWFFGGHRSSLQPVEANRQNVGHY